VWSLKAIERGTAAVLAPVMEGQGRDRYPLKLLERVVELDKVGELERVRRRSSLHPSCSYSAKGFQEKKVLGFPFLPRVRSPFCLFDTKGYDPGLSRDIYEYKNVVWTHQKCSIA
jgi:hypothetical protein